MGSRIVRALEAERFRDLRALGPQDVLQVLVEVQRLSGRLGPQSPKVRLFSSALPGDGSAHSSIAIAVGSASFWRPCP